MQYGGDHEEGDDADGKVDVEDPAPAEVFGEEPAEERSQDARRAEHRPEQALVLAAFAGRHEIADDRHGQHHQAAAAQSLDRAEADELGHVLRDAAQRGADQEDDDRGLEQLLAAVLVAELAPQGRGRGRGEHVRRDDPGQVLHAAEFADDRRQGGRDDGLVERGEQHAEEQRSDGYENGPSAVTRACAGAGGRGRGGGAARLLGHGLLLGSPGSCAPLPSWALWADMACRARAYLLGIPSAGLHNRWQFEGGDPR